jgi:hypothetical protein
MEFLCTLQGAGVNLDAGKRTVLAERFFGTASAMALSIVSKRASTSDKDQKKDDETGAHGLQAGVNIDIVRSDERA